MLNPLVSPLSHLHQDQGTGRASRKIGFRKQMGRSTGSSTQTLRKTEKWLGREPVVWKFSPGKQEYQTELEQIYTVGSDINAS